MLDLADLFHGVSAENKPAVTARVTSLLNGIVAFAIGCAAAALAYAHLKEWVFVGAPILAAMTMVFYLRENLPPAAG
jgi:membrane protein YdbS with pleckstrin-like domain